MRKLTLEERVKRLERLLAKNEDYKVNDDLANTIATAVYNRISKIDPFSEGCEMKLDEADQPRDGGGSKTRRYQYAITLDNPSSLSRFGGLGYLEMELQSAVQDVWDSIKNPRMMFCSSMLASKGVFYVSISLTAPGSVAQLAPGDSADDMSDAEIKRSARWSRARRDNHDWW